MLYLAVKLGKKEKLKIGKINFFSALFKNFLKVLNEYFPIIAACPATARFAKLIGSHQP